MFQSNNVKVVELDGKRIPKTSNNNNSNDDTNNDSNSSSDSDEDSDADKDSDHINVETQMDNKDNLSENISETSGIVYKKMKVEELKRIVKDNDLATSDVINKMKKQELIRYSTKIIPCYINEHN